MELIRMTPDDEWLTVALETDPRVMAELGGPWTVEETKATHQRRTVGIETDANWGFTIVPEPGSPPVGTIMLWPSEFEGVAMSETGWMVLPEHQGKGHASAALAMLLEKAQADGRWGDVHAFPGATNGPSNALCRKAGFELIGTSVADYADRHFPVNHWVWRAGRPPR